MATRTQRLSVAIDPTVLDAIRAAAAEVGVSPSAWAAMRLGEAVKAQRHAGAIIEQFGAIVAAQVAEAAKESGDES